MSATMASASATRPCCASQRGDSGRLRRIHQITSAPTEPMITTQRQPESPRMVVGTNCQARNAITGTAVYMTLWLKAKAEPRCSFGTSSDK